MGVDPRFASKVKDMTTEELTKTKNTLVVREESRRVKFAKSRDIAAGASLKKTREELGCVRTELQLRS